MTELVEKVARAIAAEILAQDDCELIKLPNSLIIPWLDQNEVDFGKVATAAISVVLEEAAKWIESVPQTLQNRQEIAAHIRALGRKG